MAAGCRELGIEPVVTFHHFTTPCWVARAGGWADPVTADRFARFCARAAGHLGDAMQAACTLNEPNVVATAGYLQGRFPPGERDGDRRRRVNEVFVDAHAKGAAAIKEAAGVPVGLTLAMSDDQAEPGGEAALAAHHRDWEEPYLADGLDVRGYTYWSLLDTFEWAHGYQPTFGLVAVDRTTQARTSKSSATWLGRIARANRLS